MKKSEIFDILVNKVCEVCEVREEIPDDMIPDLMHSIVRSVYEKGNLSPGRETQVQQGAAGKSQGHNEKAYAFGKLNQMSYLCRSKWCEPYV